MLARVASILAGGIAITAFLYLFQTIGIVLGVLFAAAIVAMASRDAESAVYDGLYAGLLGYILSYLLSGAGLFGMRMIAELFSWFAPLVPLLYYPLATALLAGLISQARGRR